MLENLDCYTIRILDFWIMIKIESVSVTVDNVCGYFVIKGLIPIAIGTGYKINHSYGILSRVPEEQNIL
jgi:hypothetical protein